MTAADSEKLDLALTELTKLRRALDSLAHSKSESAKDDLEWTRIPKGATRCPITGMSRTKIYALIQAETIRTKRRSGMTFFAASDWRAMMDGK